MSESEIKILQRIDSKLTKLLNQPLLNHPKKEIWITGSELTEITGWDFKRKKLNRELGRVVFKKEPGKHYLYLLSSIPNEFKKAV